MRAIRGNCYIFVILTTTGLIGLANGAAGQVRPARAGGAAFAIEAAGGTVGSVAGFGLGVLITNPENCSTDDLACTLEKVGAALAISAGGAALGTIWVGRAANTRPSALGAFVGGALGIVAGVGVVHLISEELDLSRENVVLWVGYTVTQGLVTALGSRLVRALRD